MPDEVTTTQPAAPAIDMAAITQSFTAAVNTAVAPINTRMQTLETQLAAAVKPQNSAVSQLFGGGAPAVIQGEIPGSRGYSFGRLLFGLATRDMQQCKNELDIHNRLMQAYGGQLGKGAILAPLGGYHLMCADAKLAQECSQMVRQGVYGYDPQEALSVIRQHFGGAMMQNQTTLTDPLGGYLLGPVEQGEMIDLLRAKEIFSRAGAREITMPTNGRVQFPRHKAAGAAYWVGEGKPITGSDQEFGMLAMAVKKLAALCNMPNELLRFVSASIEAFIRTELAKTMALKADSSMLNAVGSNLSVKGLTQYDILEYTATGAATDGDTLEPEDIAKMVATVEDGDIDTTNFKFVMRPLMWAGISTRRGDAVTAGDGKGPFVFRTQDADQAKGTTDRVGGYTAIKSSQIPKDGTKGSGTGLTQIVGGVFDEWLIGRAGVLEFALDQYAGPSGTNFVNDMTTIRAIQFMDAAPRREEAFIVCNDLIMG